MGFKFHSGLIYFLGKNPRSYGLQPQSKGITKRIPDLISASYFPGGSSPVTGPPSYKLWPLASLSLLPAPPILGVGSGLSLLLHLTISFAHPVPT